jgi:hypothetical protein
MMMIVPAAVPLCLRLPYVEIVDCMMIPAASDDGSHTRGLVIIVMLLSDQA